MVTSDDEQYFYRKSVCPHCHESMLIEFDTEEATVEMYVRGSPTVAPQQVRSMKTASTHLPVTRPAKVRKERSCSLCGKPGHSVTTCKENKPDQFGFDATPKVSGFDPMTKEEYAGVKEAKDCEELSKSTADMMGLPIREVNIAYSSSDYQHYLSLRRIV